MIVGGAQENTLLTIIDHIEKGHDVTLLTGPSPGPEGELLKQHDVPDFKIVENAHLVREINPFHDIAAYFSLKSFFKENKFDVVHTHSSKAGVIGRAAAYNAKVPFVVHTVHGQAFHAYEKGWKNYIYKSSERWAAKRCHKIYAVAQAMIDQCVEANVAPAEMYKVVYSGMKLEPFLNTKRDPKLLEQLKIPENRTVIGAIARLFPLKGYEYLIPLSKRIIEKHPDTHFLIVGNGIMMDDIKQQIKDMGIEDHFSFTGLVPPKDIFMYTGLMDMLVHLSLREGLPRTVVQALASGIPAIGFKLDGTPEVVIDDQTGYTVKAEDAEAVFEAICKLLDNPEQRKQFGENGRKLVSERFDWHQMGDILEEEYKKGIQSANR